MQQQTLKYSLFLLLIGFYTQGVKAQNTIAQPQNGIEQLSSLFKEISFTSEQQEELIDRTIELVFLVDETGEAKLTEIEGIKNTAILDSFYQQQSKLPKFTPQTQDGNPIASYFILEIVFKSTQAKDLYSERFPLIGRFKKDEFEFVETGKGRFESLLSITSTGHFGDAANQYQIGLGLKVDVLYIGKSGLGGGITTNIFSNQMREPDNELDINEFWVVAGQSNVALIGGVFIFYPNLKTTTKGKISLQAELNLVNQQFSQVNALLFQRTRGTSAISPALGINYSLKFGKERYQNSLFFDSEITYQLNIHAAVRPMVASLLNRGAFFEFGIGLRTQNRIVKDYKWKN